MSRSISVSVPQKNLVRCRWAADPTKEQLVAYHDREWGVPLRDERALFELLSLEAFQAGLNWSIILAKRDAFRKAFGGFEPAKVARFTERRIALLLADADIVRNRAKIEATRGNANALLALEKSGTGFAGFLWSFVDGRPIVRRPRRAADFRSTSPESDAMSKELKARGFRFVGSTICYAFMQAAGLVNDHEARCFRAPPA